MAARRILVTGATGFVGAAAVKVLRDEGESVVALHRRPRRNPDDALVAWRELDLLAVDAGEIERLVRREGITHCLHCAWYTQHEDYLVSAANLDWLDASLRLAQGFRAGG